MNWPTRPALLAAGSPILLLAACHSGPASSTGDDQRQLDQAAAALDANAAVPANESTQP